MREKQESGAGCYFLRLFTVFSYLFKKNVRIIFFTVILSFLLMPDEISARNPGIKSSFEDTSNTSGFATEEIKTSRRKIEGFETQKKPAYDPFSETIPWYRQTAEVETEKTTGEVVFPEQSDSEENKISVKSESNSSENNHPERKIEPIIILVEAREYLNSEYMNSERRKDEKYLHISEVFRALDNEEEIIKNKENALNRRQDEKREQLEERIALLEREIESIEKQIEEFEARMNDWRAKESDRAIFKRLIEQSRMRIEQCKREKNQLNIDEMMKLSADYMPRAEMIRNMRDELVVKREKLEELEKQGVCTVPVFFKPVSSAAD